MGSKYPVLPPDKVIRVLHKYGFTKVSQRGSHVKYKKEGQPVKIVIIPMLKDLEVGYLASTQTPARINTDPRIWTTVMLSLK